MCRRTKQDCKHDCLLYVCLHGFSYGCIFRSLPALYWQFGLYIAFGTTWAIQSYVVFPFWLDPLNLGYNLPVKGKAGGANIVARYTV